MPGLCGIFDASSSIPLDERLDAMLQTLRRHDWQRVERHLDPGTNLAIGRVTLGYVNRAPQPARNEDGSLLAFMHGELYETESLRAELRAAGHRFHDDSGGHAELLLHGFEQEGIEFLRRIHGSFVAAIWDENRRQLILTNDRFGLRPLYVAALPDRLLFASGIKALALDDTLSREPNWRGLSQFFSFGQYLANDTSWASVEVLPAAAWAVYDAEAGAWNVETYRQLTDDVETAGALSPSDRETRLEQLDAAFTAAVARREQGAESLGLALSGGLDARMILACLSDAPRVQTVSYGIEGSLDHRSATRLAELAGSPHTNHVLDAQFLANYRQHLLEMTRLTDGQYLSQCIILPTLPLYRQLGIEVLLRGHAGELMHMHKAYAYSLDEAALSIRDEASLERWLMSHLQGYMLAAVDRPLFKQLDAGAVSRLSLESLRECLAPAASLVPPVQRIWHLFVSQRLRRETSLSLAKFGSMVEIRVPYLDNELVRLLLSTPPEMKLGESIQTHILRRHKPEFLAVLNSNTASSVGAAPWVRKLNTFKMRVLAKLGVPGYQPYERLGLWLRQELAPLVDEILLSEVCLDRGVFEPDTVRRVIRQHAAKQCNHTYLLMAMMIYELGQRDLAGHCGLQIADCGTER